MISDDLVAKWNLANWMNRNLTPSELRLRSRLWSRRIPYRFYSQWVIHGYIADFACLQARLIIEVDGGIHSLTRDEDHERTLNLEHKGYDIIRFSNYETSSYLDAVVEAILAAVRRPAPIPPSVPIWLRPRIQRLGAIERVETPISACVDA